MKVAEWVNGEYSFFVFRYQQTTYNTKQGAAIYNAPRQNLSHLQTKFLQCVLHR